jgi:hypothetical protein
MVLRYFNHKIMVNIITASSLLYRVFPETGTKNEIVD